MSETEHKGLPVEGYKVQSQPNVDFVNRNKKVEELVLKIIDELNSASKSDDARRWLDIGKTHIELGFMAINRGVFLPSRAKLLVEDKISVNSIEMTIKPLQE